MIALKKKSSEGNSYKWRPNFRNADSLPEVRAIRTRFFLPTIAITLAFCFSSYILFQEYRAVTINDSIEVLEGEIESYKAKHDEKVKLNSEFMAISRTMDEIVEFNKGKLVASDFLLSVSSRLLDGMYLSRVEYIPEKADISGYVRVSAEQASLLVNDYLKSLEEGDVLQGLLDEYKLISLKRDQTGKSFEFRIQITKAEKKGKK